MTAPAIHLTLAELDAVDRSTLPADGGSAYNRLIFERSPYLLQHATNPVDWYPWGEAAFARARSEDKPVLLSIGYSTCHWCHVMARESFADPTVAAVLARDFIAVKVDREERPDVDAVYMNACQLMTGQGGWPLTILLTPERQPFFAATYLPREARGGLPGLIALLERVAELWRSQRPLLLASGARLYSALLELDRRSSGSAALDERPLRQALTAWRAGHRNRRARQLAPGAGGGHPARRCRCCAVPVRAARCSAAHRLPIAAGVGCATARRSVQAAPPGRGGHRGPRAAGRSRQRTAGVPGSARWSAASRPGRSSADRRSCTPHRHPAALRDRP